MTGLDQVAYAAYGQSTGGYNFRGDPMPEWEDLPPEIQAAWQAAAAAVADKVLSEFGPVPG